MLSFEIKRVKKIENSPLYMTFELLKSTYASSLFNDVKADVFKIEENHYNSKNLRLLNLMMDMIKNTNKK